MDTSVFQDPYRQSHAGIAEFVAKHPRFAERFPANAKPNIKVMRQTVIELRHEGKNILTQAENRELTSKEEARLAELDIQLGDAQTLVEAEEARLDRERDMAPMPHGSGTRLLPGAKNAFSNVFRGLSLPHAGNGGFKDREEFFKVLHSNLYDSRMMAASMIEGVGADGGYLVPVEYASWLMDGSLENEIVRPRATVVPMTTSQKKVGGFDMQNHTGGNISGFTPQWLAEGGSMTTQKGKFRSITLETKKLGCLAEASNELIADGESFEKQVGTAMMSALSFGFDDAFLTANGAGKPLGVLNDPALIVIAKESGQAADTIVYANIAKMFARLHPALRAESVWVANNACIEQLSVMTFSPVSNFIPVLREADAGYTLLTRPVIFTEKLPALGDQGDIILCNFSQYAIGLRSELGIAKSQHVGFATDTSHYRLLVRADGQGMWSQAITPKNGPTLSWAVTLAERA